MKGHWVNGNESPIRTKKAQHHRELNQTTHQNQSTTHESGEEDRGLNRKFKRGVKDKGIGHWVNGIEREKSEVDEWVERI